MWPESNEFNWFGCMQDGGVNPDFLESAEASKTDVTPATIAPQSRKCDINIFKKQ